MRSTTEVWAKFESKGHPNKTTITNGNATRVVLAFAKWLFAEGLYMGSQIQLTLARSEAELKTNVKDESSAALEAELMR